jgi:hypothetical protein
MNAGKIVACNSDCNFFIYPNSQLKYDLSIEMGGFVGSNGFEDTTYSDIILITDSNAKGQAIFEREEEYLSSIVGSFIGNTILDVRVEGCKSFLSGSFNETPLRFIGQNMDGT